MLICLMGKFVSSVRTTEILVSIIMYKHCCGRHACHLFLKHKPFLCMLSLSMLSLVPINVRTIKQAIIYSHLHYILDHMPTYDDAFVMSSFGATTLLEFVAIVVVDLVAVFFCRVAFDVCAPCLAPPLLS
jgi:hypothetical protein